ncbi:MAG: peptide ABC transporter substrate-binding protein [Candidatus Dormibacteraeota bacterium]|nr:peptide ABC transporter substrate-binding protein [Candidatus Dormibacteraeota bacterium]
MTLSLWRLRALALAVLVLTAAPACSPSSPTLTQGARLDKNQTLRVLLADQPASLDPGQTQYTYETAVLRAISEPLLRPNADLSGVAPAAAQSYDVSSNGTIYAFHLRKTAQYWDGTPVRAQDFVFAWQRLIDPRLASPSESFFAAAILNGDKVSVLDPQRDAARLDGALGTLGLKAIDDYTFQVTLAHRNPAFVWLAALPAGAPIRQETITKSGDKWSTSADSLLTNGPFRVIEMVPSDHVNVVPNPHYWGSRPTLSAIDFVIVNDGAAALAKYKNGRLDTIAVQPAQAPGVPGDASLSRDLLKTPSLSVFWLVFRLSSPPLNNVRVRRAIAEGIDRNAFVAQIFQGQGIPAETLIPKGMHGYAPSLGSAQKFDVAKARANLAASGMSAKQLSGMKLSYDRSLDFQKATAEFVRGQLKANLGLDVVLQPLDTNTFNSHLGTGDFQIAGPLGWTADYPDPADWYQIFMTTSSTDVSLYQNQQYDSFVRGAGSDLQGDRRDQEYKQAQQMLVGDAPVAFLAQSVNWNLVRSYVRGLIATPLDEWPGALFPTQIYIAPR